jgi:sec-independent protein translocase protein TatA
MPIGPMEMVILLVIVLLIFGPKKVPELGNSLGRSIREFKAGVSESDEKEKATAKSTVVTAETSNSKKPEATVSATTSADDRTDLSQEK